MLVIMMLGHILMMCAHIITLNINYKAWLIESVMKLENKKTFFNNGELQGYGEFVDSNKLDISDLDRNSNGEKSNDEPKLIYSDTMFMVCPLAFLSRQ